MADNSELNISYINKLKEIEKNYLTLLLNKERKEAVNLILNALDDKIDIKDIYLSVFQNVQYKIGELWQTGKISVAQEHFATAVTQFVMGQLYKYLLNTKKIGKVFLGLCVSEELHDIGLKMVTDLVELSGWDTVNLGANVPTNDIESAIIEYKADVIGISVTISNHLNTALQLIKHIKESKNTSNIKIIVGGYTLNSIPDLWLKLGSHGFATDAEDAVKKINQMV